MAEEQEQVEPTELPDDVLEAIAGGMAPSQADIDKKMTDWKMSQGKG